METENKFPHLVLVYIEKYILQLGESMKWFTVYLFIFQK